MSEIRINCKSATLESLRKQRGKKSWEEFLLELTSKTKPLGTKKQRLEQVPGPRKEEDHIVDKRDGEL